MKKGKNQKFENNLEGIFVKYRNENEDDSRLSFNLNTRICGNKLEAMLKRAVIERGDDATLYSDGLDLAGIKKGDYLLLGVLHREHYSDRYSEEIYYRSIFTPYYWTEVFPNKIYKNLIIHVYDLKKSNDIDNCNLPFYQRLNSIIKSVYRQINGNEKRSMLDYTKQI